MTGLPAARPPRKDGRPHKLVLAAKKIRQGWWEREHTKGTFGNGAGATPAEVIDNLGIRPLLLDGPKTVIEVGVGSGALIKHLAALGHRCYGVDISTTARARIADFAVGALGPEDAWPASDLVISYQCLQHMPDEEVLALMLRALSSAKLVACQYAFLSGDPAPWFAREVASGFNFVRAPETMEAIVHDAGGRIIHQRQIEAAPGVGWAFIRAEPT